ncbi:MAG: NFACT RNA binding domain-containing protein [Oscillospiraceae bacterium]|nr:NFACT RNA binding domain-containing protein [Oscillospiraceae bacterium]
MALDGIFLRHLRQEIEETAQNAKVDKIYQPNREELVLSLRTRYETYKLLLSARANSARVHFTTESIENPKQPPMLCMLLRKRLTSAKLVKVRQNELERVLFLDFDVYNELGDLVRLTLVIEIMGRYSNVIFLDGNGVILDALKRVDEDMSSERLVLPGLPYRSPPPQHKLSLLETAPEQVLHIMEESAKQRSLSNQLLDTLQGVSPVVCRELESRVCGAVPTTVPLLSAPQRQVLLSLLKDLADKAKEVSGTPFLAVNVTTGKPLDFSFLPITQYGALGQCREEPSFSALLDDFYQERDRLERMKVKTQGLHRVLTTASERLSRKVNLQQGELRQCTQREQLKICGDLINANLYRLKKGDTLVSLCNFYEPEQPMVAVKLNPLLTPSQNAQKYYKEYRKAKTAEEKLQEQIAMAQEELQYLDTVQEELSRASTEQELSEIRQELLEQGYIRQTKQKKQKGKIPAASAPMEFSSSDGFRILVGRNNRQNDRLTMKMANNNDLWLHVKDHPGSHTVIVSDHKAISETAILEAAQIAAYFSRCRESSQVPVDYTEVRHVSKPNGAKPGMVIYTHQKTVYVTPKQP